MKVLLYGLTEVEFEKLLELKEPFEGEGYEVAFATLNKNLISFLATEKVLIVEPKTYEADVLISMQDSMYPRQFKFIKYEGQELEKLFEEIKNVTKGAGSNDNI